MWRPEELTVSSPNTSEVLARDPSLFSASRDQHCARAYALVVDVPWRPSRECDGNGPFSSGSWSSRARLRGLVLDHIVGRLRRLLSSVFGEGAERGFRGLRPCDAG